MQTYTCTLDNESRNKSNTVMIEINGESMCLKDWCNKLDLDYKNIHSKLKRLNINPKEYLEREIQRLGNK